MRIKFGNETVVVEGKGENATFSGTGKTAVEWSVTKDIRVPREVHLSKCKVVCVCVFTFTVWKSKVLKKVLPSFQHECNNLFSS